MSGNYFGIFITLTIDCTNSMDGGTEGKGGGSREVREIEEKYEMFVNGATNTTPLSRSEVCGISDRCRLYYSMPIEMRQCSATVSLAVNKIKHRHSYSEMESRRKWRVEFLWIKILERQVGQSLRSM